MHHLCKVQSLFIISSSKKPAHFSMLSPPKIRGMCKIQTIRGVTAETPTKAGRLERTPSHMCDPVTKKWARIDEDIGKLCLETQRS